MKAFDALLTRESRQREQAHAIARPARVRFQVQTEGVGELRMEGGSGVDFGTLLVNEPSFGFGVIKPEGEVWEDGEMPTATAIVLAWVLDELGFYRGAEMAFVVQSQKMNARLIFSLVFESHALPSTKLDDLRGPSG